MVTKSLYFMSSILVTWCFSNYIRTAEAGYTPICIPGYRVNEAFWYYVHYLPENTLKGMDLQGFLFKFCRKKKNPQKTSSV